MLLCTLKAPFLGPDRDETKPGSGRLERSNWITSRSHTDALPNCSLDEYLRVLLANAHEHVVVNSSRIFSVRGEVLAG